MSEEPASPPSTAAAADAVTPREPEAVLAQEESGYDSDQTPRSNPGDPGGCGSSPGSSRSSINSGSDKQTVDRTDNGESVTISIPSTLKSVLSACLPTHMFIRILNYQNCFSHCAFRWQDHFLPLHIKVHLSIEFETAESVLRISS